MIIIKNNPISIAVRLLLWGGIIYSLFWLGKLGTEKVNAEKETVERKVLARDIETFWGLQKARVDKINKTAKDYADYYHLKPGDPLPPNTFYDVNDPTWKLMDKPKMTEIVTEYNANSNKLGAKISCMTAIGETVPEEGQHYCYAILFHPFTIYNTSFVTYPIDPNTGPALRKAGADLEKKKEQLKKAKETNP